MNSLLGISVQELPYKQLQFVGVLLFSAYPSTIVYKDGDNYPVIKEWADCSDDNTIDRYFYYSVDKWNLKRFIEGEISHSDLIHASSEGYVYFQDESKGVVINTLLISLKSIPNTYLPESDFLFENDDSEGAPTIIANFKLDTVELIKETIPAQVRLISKNENSETLYIRIQKGKGVGHGTIKTQILGGTLIYLDKLYKDVALDHLLTKDRGEIWLDAKRNEELLTYTDTEVFGQSIAASYGFMVRPIKTRLDIIDKFEITPSFLIAQKAINLIIRSKNPAELKEEYQLHSKFTIRSYESLLNEVYKNELNVDFNWFSPKSTNELSSNIDYLSANKIIEGIKELSISDKVEISLIGKFRAINCDTAWFVFISTNGEKYNGFFNENIKETLNQINFMQVYKITIERLTEKPPGKGEKISNKIIVCYLDEPNKRG